MFGLIPSVQSTKMNLTPALKAGEWDPARKGFRVRGTLVVIQIAGCLFLLVATAQLNRSMRASLFDRYGFRIDHRLTMRFAPAQAGYTPAQTEQFYKTLLDQARGVPGIRSAALASWTQCADCFGSDDGRSV